MVIHYCFVPGCSNNSERDPNKIFVTVPKNKERRANWFQAVVPDQDIRKTGSLYVCEDHFDLPNDAENWMYYKTMGQSLRMKKDSVPRINTTAVCHMTESCKKRKQENIDMFESTSSRRRLEFSQPSTSTYINTSPTEAESPSYYMHSPSSSCYDDDLSSSPVIDEQSFEIQGTQTYSPESSHFRSIPLSTVYLKPDPCESIFPHDTSSSIKSVRRRNEPAKCQQEVEIKREPIESENNVEDESQDINNRISEPDAVTVKTEDLIEFEYRDVKQIEDEHPKVFNILWHGYINLPNEFWTTNKILTGKKYIVITKFTMTQEEILVHEKQVLIHENLTLTYFVLNKTFDTHRMPVNATSVEEIENVLEFFDGLSMCEVNREPSNPGIYN